jgi:hypothetical protein
MEQRVESLSLVSWDLVGVRSGACRNRFDDGGDHEKSVNGKIQFSAVRIPTAIFISPSSHMHSSPEKRKNVRLDQGTGRQWSPGFYALRVTYYLLVRLSAD